MTVRSQKQQEFWESDTPNARVIEPVPALVLVIVMILVLFAIVISWEGANRAEAAPPVLPAAVQPQWVRVGSQSDQVAKVQSTLAGFGYTIAVDGWFGPQTDKVVRHFQDSSGLVADGIVGPNTTRALGIAASPSVPVAVSSPVSVPVTPPSSDGCYSSLLAKYGMPSSFSAIIHRESRCDPSAYNGRNRDQSYGLLQINTKGSLWGDRQSLCGLTSREQLFDPETNIACAAKLYQRSGGSPWGV
ncbi:MAG: peptidoglycan-binding protein [Acidimicrobiia bacterium]|nr:peptidoglycan-binding protein [Acidimicrobiia bacterium]